jgi:nucleoside-diphosphate-sugar epimerase
MVGARIAEALVARGMIVRLLTRQSKRPDARCEYFVGDLESGTLLRDFIRGADMLFHCAAELRDPSKMQQVNVGGTERLLAAASQSEMKFLCHLSSAGVIGRTNESWVNESTACDPQDAYEKSKYEAEQIVLQEANFCPTVMLRPTNVIDDLRPGAIGLPLRRSVSDRVKVLIKGGECAHIVHAMDIANAAVYLSSRPVDRTEIYFVSCDEDEWNTYAAIWGLYDAARAGKPASAAKPARHLPIEVAHLLRMVTRGRRNRGDVRYSSQKLRSTGFEFAVGVEGAVKRILDANRKAVPATSSPRVQAQ